MMFGFLTNTVNVTKTTICTKGLTLQPYECVRHDAVLYMRNVIGMLHKLG